MRDLTSKQTYTITFWITLVISLGLIIGGFFVPPVGSIDGSVLTAVGILFLWPALSFANKAIEEGKSAKIVHRDTTISVGDNE